jgi:hypothetical protein
MTTDEDQTSVLKCSASASSAWELYFRAARYSMRERETSITIEEPMTTKAQTEASTLTGWTNSRSTAS